MPNTLLSITTNPQSFSPGTFNSLVTAVNGATVHFTITPTAASTTYTGGDFHTLLIQDHGGFVLVDNRLQKYTTPADVMVYDQVITWSAGQTISITDDAVAKTVTISGATTGNGTFSYSQVGPYLSTTDILYTNTYAPGPPLTFVGTISNVDDASNALIGTLSSGTLKKDVLNSTGSISLIGVMSIASGTLRKDVLNATGSISLVGVLSSGTLGKDTSVGTDNGSLQGSAAITEHRDVTNATGTISLIGSSTPTEHRDVTNSTGSIKLVGVASITEARDTLFSAPPGSTSSLAGAGVGGSASRQRAYSIPPEQGVLITAPLSGWARSTPYKIDSSPGGANNSGSLVVNSGNLYQCITDGTSAGSGGPSGTGSNITDGTAHWKYVGTTPSQAVNTGELILAFNMRGTQSTLPSGSAGIPPTDNQGRQFTTIFNTQYNGFSDSFFGVFICTGTLAATGSYQTISQFGGTSNGSGAGDEMSSGWLALRNVKLAAPHTSSHNEVANSNASGICQAATITTTKKCLIVSLWGGNGTVITPGTSHTAVPLNGLTLVSGCIGLVSLNNNGYIQFAVATRLATASAVPFAEQWSTGAGVSEGAQLFTLAFEDTTLTGDALITLANDTLSSAGAISLVGALSAASGTLHRDVLNSTGSISLVGTLSSGTLGKDTVVGTSANGPISGSAAITLASDTLSSAGTISLVGTLSSGTLRNDVSNSTGSISLVGTMSVASGTLRNDVANSTGTISLVGTLVTGTLRNDVSNATGSISLVGVMSIASGTLGKDTAATTGGPFLLGSLATGTLGADTLSGTAGSGTLSPLTGSGAVTLANDSAAGIGSIKAIGSGSRALGNDSGVAAGTITNVGSATRTLANDTLQSSGGSPLTASGSVTLSNDSAVGTAIFATASLPIDRVIPTGVAQVIPPVLRPKVNKVIRLEDIDRGVKSWFENVVDANVQIPQGGRRKVSFVFSSGERWVAAADRRGIRDRDGRLVLPVIQVRRTGFGHTGNMTALGADVPRLQIARLIDEKTSNLKNLDANRPISTRRIRDSAVYDIFTVPFPRPGTVTYSIRVQASYQTHINEILEKISNSLDFVSVPSFVIGLDGYNNRTQGIRTGDGSTERSSGRHAPFDERRPLSDYYVVGYMEGDYGDRGNLEEFTDQERILQAEFSFKVPATLLLDPEGTEPAVQMQRTAFGLFLGDEQVHLVDDPSVADRIFGREK